MHRLATLWMTFMLVFVAAPVLADSSSTSNSGTQSGGGGLHVSGGGAVGYVGGSGSISGTVRGPGSAPARRAPAEPDTSAVTDGVVKPVEVREEQPLTEPVASRDAWLPLMAIGLFFVAIAILFFRGREPVLKGRQPTITRPRMP